MKSARAELLAALRRSKPALARFEALPPSHQQRWIDFVAEAKRAETRASRIDRCIQDVANQTAGRPSTGYSGTPLLQKLGVKDGHRVALVAAPRKVPEGLASLKAAAVPRLAPDAGPFDVIVLFTDRRNELETGFRAAARCLDADGGLWVAWPKRASGVATDVTEDVVREIALAGGLVDNKVCAIDEVWSGLRLVYRRKDRPARR